MKATDPVQTSVVSQQMSPLFKPSLGKIPPVLWGLAGCLSKDQSERIGQWCAGENLQVIQARLHELASHRDDSAGIGLADAVEALAIGYLWTAGDFDQQANGSDNESSVRAFEKLSAAAMRCDSICELLTKSIGLELAAVAAFIRNDPKSILKMGVMDEFEAIIDSNLDSDGWGWSGNACV